MSRKPITIIAISLLLLIGAVAFQFLFSNFYFLNSSPDASAAATRTGLVGHWTMDANDINSTAVFDKSGLNNHGTSASTFITSADITTGKINQAIDFDGSTESIVMSSTASSTYSPTNAVTISVWFKPGAISGYRNIAGVSSDGNFQGGYNLWWNDTTYSNKIRFSVNVYTNGATSAQQILPNDNKWHHAVGTYDKNAASNQIRIWLDGIEGTPATYTTPIAYWATSVGEIGAVGGPIKYYYWAGSIDDVRIYNRALSAQEVGQLYASAKVSYTSAPQRASSTSASGKKLVGYWTMDANDINGTTVYDKSGQGNNGTSANTPTKVAGKINQAMSFNGTSDWINTGTSAGNYTDNFTLSSWIKTSGNNIRIAARRINGGSVQYDFFVAITTGYLAFYTGTQYNAAIAINDNKWHLATVAINGANSKFYVDGVQSGNTFSPTITTQNIPFTIGSMSNPAGFWNGQIDDVRIYNYALSAQEVANLYSSAKIKYASAPPRIGLVGYWNMDTADMSATGATIYDKSGQKNHGTITGTTTSTGRINQARSFNGTSNYINTGDISQIENLTNLSFGLWFKVNNMPVNQRILLSKDAQVRIEYSNGNFQCLTGNSSGWVGTPPLFAPSNIKTGLWHHIVCTLTPTTHSIYLDGVLQDYSSGVYPSIGNNTAVLTIGDYDLSHGTYNFNGAIDDVRIYNYALSASEVANLYQSAKVNYVQ